MIQSWCTGLVKYKKLDKVMAVKWNEVSTHGHTRTQAKTHEHLGKRANIYGHTRIHTDTLSLTHIHTHTHTHIHTQTHTHTVYGYNIKSRDRLAEYISGRWLHLFFHLVCNSSSIREGRYMTFFFFFGFSH